MLPPETQRVRKGRKVTGNREGLGERASFPSAFVVTRSTVEGRLWAGSEDSDRGGRSRKKTCPRALNGSLRTKEQKGGDCYREADHDHWKSRRI